MEPHHRSKNVKRMTMTARWRATLYGLFIRPASRDEDVGRREFILNIVLTSFIAALLVLDCLVLYHTFVREVYVGIPFPVFTIFPAFFAVLLALSRRGHPMTASYLLIAALLFSCAYASLHWGIDLPVTLLAYAFIISTAGILLGSRIGFGVTFLTALLIAGIWMLHVNGIVIPEPQYPSTDDVIILGAFYFLIMTVSSLSNREIGRSLTRARDSERALTKERDLLELRVAERTDELRRTQFEEIEKVHRLAEFGQLSSGLFHDLLSLLTAISLRTEGYAEDESSLAAAYETTRQIRQFMRAVQEQLGKGNSREAFSLAEGIAQAIQLVSYKANKENVRISFRRDKGDPLIYTGVPFKFHQIIINLLTNAIDAYRDIPDDARRRDVVIRAEVHEGNFIVSVRDFGCGIPDASREKIFAPFFTTKNKIGGVGIGLATTRKMIEEDFQGRIDVRGSEGNGSLFTVSFPMHPSSHPVRTLPHADSIPSTIHETVSSKFPSL